MNSKYEISVIMSTFNGEEYVREAIDSILNQSFANFEFIIINDGSTDNTDSIVKSYNDPRITYLEKKNTGIADSLNKAIELASGKYIARMDDDDISFAERLITQYNFLEANDDYILCCTNVKLSNPDKNVEKQEESHEQLKMKLLFYNPIVHPTVMVRADLLKSLLYKKDMPPSEDYDLWVRMIAKGKFIKLKTPLLHYRHNTQSETLLRRKEQLTLNKDIALQHFKNCGFPEHILEKKPISILSSNNYDISMMELKQTLVWLKSLIATNQEMGIFKSEEFFRVVEQRRKKYLESFFKNNRLKRKIGSFLNLNLKDKKFILSLYV